VNFELGLNFEILFVFEIRRPNLKFHRKLKILKHNIAIWRISETYKKNEKIFDEKKTSFFKV
jgi:hypothetical protein